MAADGPMLASAIDLDHHVDLIGSAPDEGGPELIVEKSGDPFGEGSRQHGEARFAPDSNRDLRRSNVVGVSGDPSLVEHEQEARMHEFYGLAELSVIHEYELAAGDPWTAYSAPTDQPSAPIVLFGWFGLRGHRKRTRSCVSTYLDPYACPNNKNTHRENEWSHRQDSKQCDSQ